MPITKGEWALVDSQTKQFCEPEQVVHDFRGDMYILVGGEPPKSSQSTGHIFIRTSRTGFTREVYPSVCGLEWTQ